MKYRGLWSSDTEYSCDDIIRYSDGSVTSSWIALAASTGEVPVENGTSWGLLSMDGSQGSQGSTGSQGPQGNQGTPGAQGDTGSQGPQGYQGQTGCQGPIGLRGSQGATGFSGMVYTGDYNVNRAYAYQQAVNFSGTVYVAMDIAPVGVTPPNSPWVICPGYKIDSEFKSNDVTVVLNTSSDFVSDKVTGQAEIPVTIQECTAGDYGNGLAFVNGMYPVTFKGTITVTVPNEWTNSDFLLTAVGATVAKQDNDKWTITCADTTPVTVLFFGVSGY